MNIALHQPISASSQWADACAAAKANNGSDDANDDCGGWSPSGSDAEPWLQIDLGSARQISAIELVTRQNCCDQPETRQNFEIRASNDPNFGSYVVLGSQGSTVLPFQSTWAQNVSDPTGYRYIRATKAGYFFIAELRVLAEAPVAPSDNLALNRPASASSQWADACAAAKANNGSDDVNDNCGGWSPTGSDAQPWWQVDLGQAYQITTIELVTRQNCCDQPETRQNFEIRASNDPDFGSYVVLGSQGSTVLPFQSTWTQTVTDPNGYRYIRATKAGYFFIAELKVYGSAAAAQPANNLYYIYADHLNTPRVITDTANTIVWRNDQADPFAASLPNEDPDGNGTNFEFNLRFPGQYFDKETGLHYNYFRDYDPAIGRYTTSDPIGLAGGINTYGYASQNPLSLVDPLGLANGPAIGWMAPKPPCVCPKPPKAPPGVSCDSNIKLAQQPHFNPLWFYDQVRNKGPWDYKQKGEQYEAFGNFNFGATGAAFGLSSNVLHRGAGWAQQAAGTSQPQWGNWYGFSPYGDDPSDQYWIEQGYNYFKCGCHNAP